MATWIVRAGSDDQYLDECLNTGVTAIGWKEVRGKTAITDIDFNDIYHKLQEIYPSDSNHNIVYGIGIALEIPEGYVGLIFPRSSNSKQDLLLSNSVGVIDSGYRGEIIVKFKKTVSHANSYNIGERVAQLVLMKLPAVHVEEVTELSTSERGEGGFGSTGK